MMSNKHLSIFLLGFLGLLLPVSLPAQTAEWQPISPQELALHDNPNHPGDAAMVLLREINTNDEKRFQTNYYRIKIFKEEGKKYADIEIPYFEKETQIEDIRARTIRPDGTTVEFHGEVFDKVVQKSKGFELHIKALAIPAIEIGSIVEYSYSAKWREKFPDVLQHPDQYIIKHPLTFPTERWVLQGNLFIRRERFVLRPLPKATLQWALVRPPQNAAVQQAKDGTVSMELHNIEALETEEFMFTDDMLNSRVHFWY